MESAKSDITANKTAIQSIQRDYVTRQELGEAVRGVEASIEELIMRNEKAKENEKLMFMEWMRRMERQIQVANDDIKRLLERPNDK